MIPQTLLDAAARLSRDTGHAYVVMAESGRLVVTHRPRPLAVRVATATLGTVTWTHPRLGAAA